VDDLVRLFDGVRESGVPLAGLGLTGLRPETEPAPLLRLVAAAGL
jgi:hypothetical protein